MEFIPGMQCNTQKSINIIHYINIKKKKDQLNIWEKSFDKTSQ